MSLTRLRQLSTNPCHLRQGERSSGTEFRTLSFNYRDADDQGIPQLHTRGETSSSYRGSGRSGCRAGGLRRRTGLRRRRPGSGSRQTGRHERPRRQARHGRRRDPGEGRGQGREEHHHDGRHHPRGDRAGQQAAGRRRGVRARPDLRQARLRSRERPDEERRVHHQGGLEALLRPRHRSQAGDQAGRPDAQGRPGGRGEAAEGHGQLPGARQEDAGDEPVQPLLRDGCGRLRREAPRGGRPRDHHRHPGLRRRPRSPGPAEDHHRRAQDRRLGDGDRPGQRRRRHLAPDDGDRHRTDVHVRREDLLRPGGQLPVRHVRRVGHHRRRHGGRPQPRR